MKTIYLMLFVVSILWTSGCSTKDENHERGSVINAAELKTTGGSEPQKAVVNQTRLEDQPTVAPTDRKIIKHGSIAFETNNTDSAGLLIKKSITALNGFISEESIKLNHGKAENIISVLVPAENFDLLLNNITTQAGKLDKKDIGSEDVTEEFIDTEARIKSKLALEQRYFELLKQSKTMDDILKMEAQLSIVRNEIESAQGRINYINRRTACSVLEITFYEPAPAVAEAKSPGFFDRISIALQTGWEIILELTIALTTIWPLMIVFAVIAFFYRRNKKMITAK